MQIFLHFLFIILHKSAFFLNFRPFALRDQFNLLNL